MSENVDARSSALWGPWAYASLVEIRRRLADAPPAVRAPVGEDWQIMLVCLRDGGDGPEIGVVYEDGAGLIQDWGYPLRFAVVQPSAPSVTDPDIVATLVVTSLFEPKGPNDDLDFDFGVLALSCLHETQRRFAEDASVSTRLEERGLTLDGISIEIGAERPEIVVAYRDSGGASREHRYPVRFTGEASTDDPGAVADTIVSDFFAT